MNTASGAIKKGSHSSEYRSKRIKPNGAVYSNVRGNDSPFATALCVQILNLADGKHEKETLLNQALKWLIQNQLSDGSWESSAMFSLPKPGNINPELPPCNNFPDDKRLFTTATVLTALSGIQLENQDNGVMIAVSPGFG
ncbi:MAG: hypothetical protein ACFCUV_21015 [Rivularia sp. (in: cyanobacteria)]